MSQTRKPTAVPTTVRAQRSSPGLRLYHLPEHGAWTVGGIGGRGAVFGVVNAWVDQDLLQTQAQPLPAQPTFWDGTTISDTKGAEAVGYRVPSALDVGGLFEQLAERFESLWSEYANTTLMHVLLHRTQSLEFKYRTLDDRVSFLEGQTVEPVVAIDWVVLEAAVNGAIEELGWSCDVGFDPGRGAVSVVVRFDVTDLVADTTFEFYRRIASVVGGEVMRAVMFDFEALE